MKPIALGALALAAALGLAMPAVANGYQPGAKAHKPKAYYPKSRRIAKRRSPRRAQVAGFRLSGGYRFGYEIDPYVREHGNWGYYPYFNNSSLADRVEYGGTIND